MRRVVVPLLALAAGCAGERPMTVMADKSDFADGIRWLFWEIIALDGMILVIVIVLVVLAIARYSKRTGLGSEVGHTRQLQLEVAWTVGPALVLMAIAIPSVRMTFKTQAQAFPPGGLDVHVVAHQWWWEFQYPGLGVVTANEAHVPVGQPVRLRFDSADVIHSFWVPQLGGKRDVVPGQTNEIALVPRIAGTYLGTCAEFCGTSHANMRFRVVVDEPREFDAWAARQREPAAPRSAAAGRVGAGARAYAQSTCTPCHTIGGVSTGRFGPDLTHFASRATFAGGTIENTPDNVAAWLRDPDALKPGAKMPRLALPDGDVASLVAYLESLE